MMYDKKLSDHKLLNYGYYGRFSDFRFSDDMKTIPLLGGMYQDCSVYYDKESDMLKLSNADKTFKCCLDNFKNINKICNNKCDNKYDKNTVNNKNCKKICDIMKDKLVESCNTSRELKGNKDPFIQEALKLKCWDKETNKPNNDCIEKNKNFLIDKCMKNCNENAYLDCTSHCNTSYDLVINPKDVSNLFENVINSNIDKTESIKMNKSIIKSILIISFFGVILGIFLSIIYLILEKYFKLN